MRELTPNEKGGIAEMAIANAAVREGILVSRPMTEGGRYDLIFDFDTRLWRVQCKWARFKGDVVVIATRTNRTTPNGYVRGTYSSAEIDMFAAYCFDLDEVYLLPIREFDGQSHVHLRLKPCRNQQAVGVKWAEQYRLGAVAQLGERLGGTQKAAGSSPASSTSEGAVRQGGLFAF